MITTNVGKGNFFVKNRTLRDNRELTCRHECAWLMRRCEAIKQEVQTYENNLGFLNVSSKKGNSLIDGMNRKVRKLRDDMNLVREKTKAIDAESQEE